MTGVITADIVNSRGVSSVQEWLDPLKDCLALYGDTPRDWEVYRGDSFQLALPLEATLKASVHLKATVKCIRNMDVRMAIGVGEVSYRAENVTESNGSAFIYSGELFEELEKNRKNFAIRTSFVGLNEFLNATLDLAAIIMDDWNPGAAQVVRARMDDEEMVQTELADRLGISQVAVSKGLQRANYTEIRNYIRLVTQRINAEFQR